MVSIVARTSLLDWLPWPLLQAEQAAGTIRLIDVKALALRRRSFLYQRRRGLLPLGALRLRDCILLLEQGL